MYEWFIFKTLYNPPFRFNTPQKHFTLSRAQGGVDSSFSLEPDEMRELVVKTDDTYHALGGNNYIRPKLENENKIFRRSLYFVRDVEEGEVITNESVRRIRPGFGLAPKYFDDLIGRELAVDVNRGDAATFDVLVKK